jgi:hypothetical protein
MQILRNPSTVLHMRNVSDTNRGTAMVTDRKHQQ